MRKSDRHRAWHNYAVLCMVLNLLVCDLSEVVLIHLFMAKTKKFSEMKFVLI